MDNAVKHIHVFIHGTHHVYNKHNHNAHDDEYHYYKYDHEHDHNKHDYVADHHNHNADDYHNHALGYHNDDNDDIPNYYHYINHNNVSDHYDYNNELSNHDDNADDNSKFSPYSASSSPAWRPFASLDSPSGRLYILKPREANTGALRRLYIVAMHARTVPKLNVLPMLRDLCHLERLRLRQISHTERYMLDSMGKAHSSWHQTHRPGGCASAETVHLGLVKQQFGVHDLCTSKQLPTRTL